MYQSEVLESAESTSYLGRQFNRRRAFELSISNLAPSCRSDLSSFIAGCLSVNRQSRSSIDVTDIESDVEGPKFHGPLKSSP